MFRLRILPILAAAVLLPAAPRASFAQSLTHIAVRRFQWNPIVVDIEAVPERGVEMFFMVNDKWCVGYFDVSAAREAVANMDEALRSADAPTSMPAATGLDGASLRIVSDKSQGDAPYEIVIHANPSPVPLGVWVRGNQLRQVRDAFAKAADIADRRALAHPSPQPNVVYEMWEVDSMPEGARSQSDLGDSYGSGTLVVSFVVDSTGKIDPASVAVHDAPEDELAKHFQQQVVGWPFTPGFLNGHPVAVQVVQRFDLEGPPRINSKDGYRITP